MLVSLTKLKMNDSKLSKALAPARLIAICALIIFTVSSCGSGGSDQQQDPLVVEEPIAYVKRPIPRDDNDVIISDNILEPAAFNGGATLYLKDRASQTAEETNLTDAIFGPDAIYDVKDVEASYDGRKLIFSMRAPQIDNADEEDQPKWRLWEYNLDTNSVSRVFGIDDDISGQFHDISPSYLPDGRIVFSSTRQVRNSALLFNSGQSPYKYTIDDEDIFNLHVYDPENDPSGNFIQQITFSHSHDLQPTVLQDGRIAFLRSEIAEGIDKLSIYTINIDGSNMRILYGYHSQTTGNTSDIETTFVDLRELSDGSLSAILQARDSSTLGGDIIQINKDGFTDFNQATAPNAGDSGVGQQTITARTVNLDDDISTHGYFNSAYPINGESLFLVSWNPCRLRDPEEDAIVACSDENLLDPALEAAPPFFGLWIYDTTEQTQNPITIGQEGEMFSDVVVMEDKPIPAIAESNLDTMLEANDLAILNIRSVYDVSEEDPPVIDYQALSDPTITSAAERPARFLRLIKPTGLPSDVDNSAFGINQNRGMRQIIGYTPIEPDGSVRVAVPADVAFHFDIVDANGEKISPLHRNNLQVRAGETYNCIGCHTAGSELPHGRIDAEAQSNNPGAAGVGTHFFNTRYSGINGVADGDTMAEVFALAAGEERVTTTDLLYTDDWSTPPTTPSPDISYRYDAMPAGTIAPVSADCQSSWFAECSAIINYPDQIQTLWELNRPNGACIACHTTNGNTQSAAGQLELTNQASPEEENHFESYRELLQQDTPQLFRPDNGNPFIFFIRQDVDGPVRAAIGNTPTLFRLFTPGDDISQIFLQSFDNNNAPITIEDPDDPAGVIEDPNNPGVFIPDPNQPGSRLDVLVQIDPSDIPNPPVMRLSNSRGSSFFDKLEGNAGTVDHSSFMTQDELRLLREWLDIGGQYYNNPLDAPLD